MEDNEKQILDVIKESNEIYRVKGSQSALDKLLYAWEELITEPKTKNKMATVLVSFIAKYYFDMNLFDKALYWGEILKESQKYKIDSGEGYFLCGKIYFEMGQKSNAFEEFKIAWEKSDGRIFKDKPKIYLDFYRNSKKV
ncbi:MAG: hypothetical protein LBT25_00040 [Candidatus Symbiothrix sp.]|jgi:hypothetical protein|nr:hypothetical protein [Candidatus Symbiothrix sp.]